MSHETLHRHILACVSRALSKILGAVKG